MAKDGKEPYDSFFADPQRGLVEVACWAHTRRYFHKALHTDAAHMGAVLAEDAANFPKAFPASAMMGLIPGAAGTFRSVAQITTSVARYAMIGCMATGAMPAAFRIRDRPGEAS